MKSAYDFGLTNCEVEILQIAANTDDHHYDWLAILAELEYETVKSRFRDILWKMQVPDCGCAVQEALRHEIVHFDPEKL